MLAVTTCFLFFNALSTIFLDIPPDRPIDSNNISIFLFLIKVKGFEKQQVFKYLTEDSNGRSMGEIRWNFEKFLVSREGKLVRRFRSNVDPNQDEITSAIESLL